MKRPRETLGDDEDRDWIELSEAKGHLGLGKLEEARKDLSPTGFRGNMALLT